METTRRGFLGGLAAMAALFAGRFAFPSDSKTAAKSASTTESPTAGAGTWWNNTPKVTDDPISEERLRREMEALYKACSKGGSDSGILFFPPGTYTFDNADIHWLSTPWYEPDARKFLFVENTET